jgi:plasmid maintenance system antidote protein VapI
MQLYTALKQAWEKPSWASGIIRRQLRRDAITVTQLAKRIGIHRSQISRFLHHKRQINSMQATRLYSYTKLSPRMRKKAYKRA